MCKIRARHELQPHKVRCYLKRRDPTFEDKMAEVLCVYREVAVPREAPTPPTNVAFISYDEKPGILVIDNTALDLSAQPSVHKSFARDHDYQRHGTLSLLASVDLLTGRVGACTEDHHRSCEFIGFFKRLDEAYPKQTAIKLILDNQSAHVSNETTARITSQPEGRLCFVSTPTHASWLDIVEGFFSKMTRSMLRHIRIASKETLKVRVLAGC